ncbi:MAG: acetyl-CoA carboxylase biotin carboxylase subunit [bacterium]|nr:acetyl-CoA carboxylase biotin carboxylase subunit [bacterium]
MKAGLKKVLIANRGEIALRVNRACHELDIPTVAIFSEADRESLHVKRADEAFCVGPGPSARSYLNVPNIISAALISGADAIHPGYGFLAENARFAEICRDHGIAFIGPSPDAIRAMGDKATAKRIMVEAKVPVTPGTDIVESVEEARAFAKRAGYPVLIKATAGGGGKGMRAVHAGQELEQALSSASSEALAAFGDGRVYLEKLIERPRHIEVQVLADTHGEVLILGERDCSVQKPSHQKLIEEAPGPRLGAEFRRALYDVARDAVKAVKYVNAGTLEFLADGDAFYFMEMNTRIQVEHPVTEAIFDIDLVKEQLRVAAGERLSYRQSDLRACGHAIEVRVNAEDPANNFAPAAGTLKTVQLPGGPGIRVDTHLYEGASVPPYYDSMLAKIIAHGRDRDEAIARMVRALRETVVDGVKTTVPFCIEVLTDPEFAAGGVDIGYLPRLLARESRLEAAAVS